MNSLEIVPSVLDRIRKTLVGLKMPRALEVLDHAVRQLERGETSALEVIGSSMFWRSTAASRRLCRDWGVDERFGANILRHEVSMLTKAVA